MTKNIKNSFLIYSNYNFLIKRSTDIDLKVALLFVY